MHSLKGYGQTRVLVVLARRHGRGRTARGPGVVKGTQVTGQTGDVAWWQRVRQASVNRAGGCRLGTEGWSGSGGATGRRKVRQADWADR